VRAGTPSYPRPRPEEIGQTPKQKLVTKQFGIKNEYTDVVPVADPLTMDTDKAKRMHHAVIMSNVNKANITVVGDVNPSKAPWDLKMKRFSFFAYGVFLFYFCLTAVTAAEQVATAPSLPLPGSKIGDKEAIEQSSLIVIVTIDEIEMGGLSGNKMDFPIRMMVSKTVKGKTEKEKLN